MAQLTVCDFCKSPIEEPSIRLELNGETYPIIVKARFPNKISGNWRSLDICRKCLTKAVNEKQGSGS
jgi:hypothetical protein